MSAATSVRRQSSTATTIRRYARWGPYLAWLVAAALVGDGWLGLRLGEPVSSLVWFVWPVLINVGAGMFVWYMRPRLRANAERWEAIERGEDG